MAENLWVEAYRPQTINDCIIPDRLKKVFEGYVKEGNLPNLLFFGGPGIGKTTVAEALCKEIGASYMKINSSEERGIDTIRTKMRNYASTISLDGGKKVLIIDEADGLTADAQGALRGSIEEFSSNVSFILTCNYKAKLIEAIHSRCPNVDFNLRKEEKPAMAAAFMERIKVILEDNDVQYEQKAVVQFIMKFFPDYRRILGELEKISKFGPIDARAIAAIPNIRQFPELLAALKAKDFKVMRKWVTDNSDGDSVHIIRGLTDALGDFVVPESQPQAIITLNEYQYKAAFVADQELCLAACLTELMAELEFK